MIKIVYPEPAFNIRKEKNKDFIFDALRKKWMILTPEEWVRQNMVQYLIQTKNYPSSLIAIEKEIRLGELKKRFDILVYNSDHQPWMMIECKATDVTLNETVLQQLLRYNLSVPVQYLIISNGHFVFGWERGEQEFKSITELPDHT